MRARAGPEHVKMSAYQIAEPRSLPVLAHHQILRFRQSLDALTELFHELINARALACCLRRHALHDRELVLGSMGEFAHQELRMLLSQLEFR